MPNRFIFHQPLRLFWIVFDPVKLENVVFILSLFVSYLVDLSIGNLRSGIFAINIHQIKYPSNFFVHNINRINVISNTKLFLFYFSLSNKTCGSLRFCFLNFAMVSNWSG